MRIRKDALAGIGGKHRSPDALGDLGECLAGADRAATDEDQRAHGAARRSAASSIAAGSGIGKDGVRRVFQSPSTGIGRTSRGSERCTGRGRVPRNTP